MLDAELTQLYYSRVAGRLHRWDTGMKIFLACTTSGTVAGWAIWTDAVQYPNGVFVWKVFSGFSALVAVALPILNLAKKVEWATSLTSNYGRLLGEYELFWAQVETAKPAQIAKFMQDLQRKEGALAPVESHFPKRDEKLVRECQRDVNHKRGLDT